jgi:[pyruvate, water dikinase]-phosphate phosphotransferase / [pyruvate, water dikinase] kinase
MRYTDTCLGVWLPAMRACVAVGWVADVGGISRLGRCQMRSVYFVSDQTGVTAETMGHSLLTQFSGVALKTTTIPFIANAEIAQLARAQIEAQARLDGVRPIIFSTILDDEVRAILVGIDAVFLDFFSAFVTPIEVELGVMASKAVGKAHGIADNASYAARINATNFAMANDDGASTKDYEHADVILVGVSRSGKTPTCLYMALQYGVYAANFPLTDDDLDSSRIPAALRPYHHKLAGLTIDPKRLVEIRQERRPNSRYASVNQVEYECRQAEMIFNRNGIVHFDTTICSVEEIGSRILQNLKLSRRVHP